MDNKNYKWVVVGLLWFVCFFNYADNQGHNLHKLTLTDAVTLVVPVFIPSC